MPPQALGHRLHRLAAPVQQQAPQIGHALGPLITTRQRREHLRRERLQPTAHTGELLGSHAFTRTRQSNPDQAQQADLTKHY